MLSKKTKKTLALSLTISILSTTLFISSLVFAAGPNDLLPSEISISITKDPTTSVDISWTTVDTTLTGNVVQVMEKSASSTFDASKALSYNATTTIQNVGKSTIKDTNGNTITQKAFNSSLVTGLKPNTEYVYRCGATNCWSSIGTFKTASSDSNAPLTFTYIADPQNSSAPGTISATNATLNELYNKVPNAAFTYIAGDFTDEGDNEGQYEGLFSANNLLSNKVTVGTQGNHESYAKSGNPLLFGSHFGFKNIMNNNLDYVYSFDEGPAHFIVLNTEYNSTSNPNFQKMVDWLKADASSSSKPWKIVMLHKPLYSGAEHIADADMQMFRENLAPVFNQLKIDAILGGHDHVFSRGFVDLKGNNAHPQMLDNKTALEPNAPYYMVANTGGGLKWYTPIQYTPNSVLAPNYSFLDRNSAQENNNSNIQNQTYSVVSVTNNTLSFNTYMFHYNQSSNAIDVPTYLYDTYTIAKSTPASQVDISSDKASVHKGDNVTYTATINAPEKANSASLTVNYDSSAFDFVCASSVNQSILSEVNSSTAGTLKIVLANTNGQVNGEKVNITLKAKADSKITQGNSPALNVTAELGAFFNGNSYKMNGSGTKQVEIRNILGDINGDSAIDISDLSLIVGYFGADNSNGDWNTKVKYMDENNNGSIDIQDIIAVANKIVQ